MVYCAKVLYPAPLTIFWLEVGNLNLIITCGDFNVPATSNRLFLLGTRYINCDMSSFKPLADGEARQQSHVQKFLPAYNAFIL